MTPIFGFGDGSMGITAGSGNEGAGETDLREEKDERRLWLTALGGFIGRGTEVGVPGADGTGEPTAMPDASVGARRERCPKSGGAGLLEEIRLAGKSIFAWLARSVYCPSLVFSEYM